MGESAFLKETCINLTALATPIYALESVLLGGAKYSDYAASKIDKPWVNTNLAMSIEQLALARTVKSLKISNTQLNTIMEYLPRV